MSEAIVTILAFIGIILLPFAIGLVLNFFILDRIENQVLRKVLRILFCIVLLPAMIAFWNADNLTESEKMLFPFSLSLRAKSFLVLLTYAAYAYGYYWLFTHLF